MSKYYKLQAELLTLPLTPRAVLLYTILADRQELSHRTGEKYHDKDGYYIIYRIEDICTVLGVGERTARYLLAELEDMKLISTRKQGKGLPQKIYVYEVEVEVSDRQKIAGQERQKIAGQERQKIAGQERQKTAGLNSSTNTNNTDTSSSRPDTSSSRPDTSSSRPDTSSSRLPELLRTIDECAAELSLQLDDKARLKLLRKIQKHSKKIHSLRAWLRTVLSSGSMLESIAADDDDSGKGYQPSYDIAEYESTSVLDEEWDD